jgi:hypothetical protein
MPVTFAKFASFNAPDAVLYVLNLYRTVVHREPQATELNSRVGILDAGATRTKVAASVWKSPEHRGLEVDQFYATYLNRPADPGGRTYWVSALLRGVSETTLARSLLVSKEYRAAHPGVASYVAGLYRDVLGIAPSRRDTSRWVNASRHGLGRAAMAKQFLTSTKAANRLVGTDYNKILGRAAKPVELTFWASRLKSGRETPSSIAERFLASNEFQARFQQGVVSRIAAAHPGPTRARR